jgi:Holliday junction resolvase RusA-like endonuclease
VIPFEFEIPGRPVSQQARRRSRVHEWTQRVNQIASSAWTAQHSQPAATAAILLFYLYDEVRLDADNIVKPILDGIMGIVFDDDSVVSDIVIRRRCLADVVQSDAVSSTLAAAFDRSEEFIYVRVEDAPAQDALP